MDARSILGRTSERAGELVEQRAGSPQRPFRLRPGAIVVPIVGAEARVADAYDGIRVAHVKETEVGP